MKPTRPRTDGCSDKLSQEMERLRFAISSSEDGMWEYDIKAGKTYVSKRWLDILGYKEGEYHSSIDSWKALLHPDDAEKALGILMGSIANKVESAHVRYRIRHKDGHWLWIYDRAKILFGPDGEPLIVAGFRTDITRQMELQTQNEELAAIVRNASTEVYILDEQTLRYLYANDGALNNLGYTLDELEKLHLTDIDIDITGEQIDIFRRYLDTIAPVLSNVSSHRRKNGSLYPVQATIHKLTYQHKPAIVIFDTNIAELTAMQDRLQHLVTHDPLTGLPNRVLLLDRLRMAIRQTRRKEEKIALLCINLDHFNQVNNSLGHSAGDDLLIEVAKRLQLLLRQSDTVARVGGDEFNVLLNIVSDPNSVISLCQTLVDAFREPFTLDRHHFYTTMSIGIALYPDDGTSAEELLKNADTAMHKAKAEGRNTFQFYADEMGQKALERVVLENSIRIALKEQQLKVYYQPQINLRDGTIVGLEALIRWNHPSMGVVLPDAFISLCEETGLIREIDFYVLENVVKQNREWSDQGIRNVKIAVNFSAKTLTVPFIATKVHSMLDFHGCPKESIAIEVTESQIMDHPEKAIRILEELKTLGMEIAIDDFGTGHSSLSYLKQLPVQKLKIDQSFVRNIPRDDSDSAITKTIIDLARNLNLSVIAEGVETADQQDFLIANGCFLAQGYLYSKPLDAASATVLLQSWEKGGGNVPKG